MQMPEINRRILAASTIILALGAIPLPGDEEWRGDGSYLAEVIVNHIVHAGALRVRLEYTNTSVEFWQSEPRYDTDYNHRIYRTGYRFEGRALGAGLDGDSEVLSAGLTLSDARDRTWNGLARYGTINEKGDGLGTCALHTVSSEELHFFRAQLSHRRPIEYESLKLGTLSLGLGVQ